jgi:peptide-methionine (R)-S-oxide reductase
MTFSLTQPSRRTALLGGAVLGLLALGARGAFADAAEQAYAGSPFRKLTDADWKARLPSAAYGILRHENTENPFTSPLLNEHRKGTFACLGCGLPLFKSQWKFDSGTGWPSFYRVISRYNVAQGKDTSLGMLRDAVSCARCDAHLGHVFDDGPKPTGLRYCMNSVSLRFVPYSS